MIRALAAVLPAVCALAPAAVGQAPAAAAKPFDKLTMEDVLGAVRNRTNMTFSADFTAPPVKRYDSSGKLTETVPPTPTTGHGTQVEYFSADGKVFLWYPGNAAIVAGEWKTGTVPLIRKNNGAESRTELPTLCFKYAGDAGFTCKDSSAYLRRVTDSTSGDPFGLSHRTKPPFMLERERTTLEALRKRMH
jgi:hypothetical protein